jgi:hypothetical protein
MGYTNRKWPVREIAICLQNLPGAPGHEGSAVGDIAEVRPPYWVTGRKERQRYLWLRVDGLEENEYKWLTDSWTEPLILYDRSNEADVVAFQHRRFCIPLKRLKQVLPYFDIVKALDINICYQPFLPIDTGNFLEQEMNAHEADEGDGRFLSQQTMVLDVHGLVYDKARGEYL